MEVFSYAFRAFLWAAAPHIGERDRDRSFRGVAKGEPDATSPGIDPKYPLSVHPKRCGG